MYTRFFLFWLTVLELTCTGRCTTGTWIALQNDHQAKVWCILVDESLLLKSPKVATILVAMITAPIADAIAALSVAISLYRSLPKIQRYVKANWFWIHIYIYSCRMRHIITWLLVMTINTGLILVWVLCFYHTYFLTTKYQSGWHMYVGNGKLYFLKLNAMDTFMTLFQVSEEDSKYYMGWRPRAQRETWVSRLSISI